MPAEKPQTPTGNCPNCGSNAGVDHDGKCINCATQRAPKPDEDEYNRLMDLQAAVNQDALIEVRDLLVIYDGLISSKPTAQSTSVALLVSAGDAFTRSFQTVEEVRAHLKEIEGLEQKIEKAKPPADYREAHQLKFCSQCGKVIPESSIYCPECGTQLQDEPKPKKKVFKLFNR